MTNDTKFTKFMNIPNFYLGDIEKQNKDDNQIVTPSLGLYADEIRQRVLNEFAQTQSKLKESGGLQSKRSAKIPDVSVKGHSDIAADVLMEENNDIPDFTKEELMHEIDLLKKSSNCDSITEYKRKIVNGEIINFSHAQIKIWEMLEGKLQELEDAE